MAKDPMVGARIPQNYIEEIDTICNETGRSRSQVIFEAIEIYLGKESSPNMQSELKALKQDVEALKKRWRHLILEAS
jgi:metal-responsive CopG/Arc/MetJ family transcriptional regulator